MYKLQTFLDVQRHCNSQGESIDDCVAKLDNKSANQEKLKSLEVALENISIKALHVDYAQFESFIAISTTNATSNNINGAWMFTKVDIMKESILISKFKMKAIIFTKHPCSLMMCPIRINIEANIP